jgi:peptidoglycan hydrolase CwlO-like protein
MNIGETSASLGAMMAISSAIVQSETASISTSLVVPALSAIIGSAMSYAVLKTTVTKLERDVQNMRNDMSEIYSLLRETMTKIAHIEGRLEDRRSSPRD